MKFLQSILLLGVTAAATAAGQTSMINFKHLEHLTERIAFLGDSVDIVHVYANYPTYDWVGAAESGMEGIACVDDAARAAVMYLRHYELMKTRSSLMKGKALLSFVLKMETDDGMFYNFIHTDHTINTTGRTSFKSFGWWGARAVWAMSTGFRILSSSDREFAGRLKNGIERTFPHIDSLLLHYNESGEMHGYRVPQWLLYGSGADVTSELLLGLVDYYSVTREKRVKAMISKLADGLMMMQDGHIRTFPYGAHRSWQTMWHMWGNGETQALAAAGRILKNRRMIESAEREVTGFYTRLLIDGFKKEMNLADPSISLEYEQIAYGVRPMCVGLIRLYEATRKIEYLKMAGLAASWLLGNNVLHTAIYDSATGRCYDGIRDSASLNRNSGAESTIEALYALVELDRYPLAMKYLSFRKTKKQLTSRYLLAVFENSRSEQFTLAVDLMQGNFKLLEGRASDKFLNHLK